MNLIKRFNPPLLATLSALMVSLMVASNACLALPEDRAQPIKINADRAVRNDRTGVTEFIGNATLSQGTLEIAADHITINYNDDGIRDILAAGSPAILKQVPSLDQAQVTAKANQIEYRVAEEIVHLQEQASIDQGGSVITSDLIRYDINQSLAEASGENRVNIVIPPNKSDSGG